MHGTQFIKMINNGLFFNIITCFMALIAMRWNQSEKKFEPNL